MMCRPNPFVLCDRRSDSQILFLNNHRTLDFSLRIRLEIAFLLSSYEEIEVRKFSKIVLLHGVLLDRQWRAILHHSLEKNLSLDVCAESFYVLKTITSFVISSV